jgi:hypothetical protein
METHAEDIQIDGRKAVVVRPVQQGRWPGVVMAHEVFGIDDVLRRHAQRLASAGFIVPVTAFSTTRSTARPGYALWRDGCRGSPTSVLSRWPLPTPGAASSRSSPSTCTRSSAGLVISPHVRLGR